MKKLLIICLLCLGANVIAQDFSQHSFCLDAKVMLRPVADLERQSQISLPFSLTTHLALDSTISCYLYYNQYNQANSAAGAITIGYQLGNTQLLGGCGISYQKTLQARINLGFNGQYKKLRYLCHIDAAEQDLRYNAKLMLGGDLPTQGSLYVGFYAATDFGFGLAGEYNPWSGLIIQGGMGWDPLTKEKFSFRSFLGLGWKI